MTAPLLIALPHGLNVSGVTMWGVRLANGLVSRGRPVGLMIHPELPGQQRLEIAIDPRVRVGTLDDVPPIDRCAGDLSSFLPAYRRALAGLAAAADMPVVISPNLHGDSYGIASALAAENPRQVRVVGWQHSDIEYDTRILQHYEPIIARFVGVSDAIADVLRLRLPARTADVLSLPYGVEVPAQLAPRREATHLRLIYTGRLDHQQKRIGALVSLSDELAGRGLEHRLTIVGEGPARSELQSAVAGGRGARIRLIGPAAPAAINTLLREHDFFILPSRYEGLSISMLEAMAAGCIPVVARTRSGALQAIEPGWNGAIADMDPEAEAEVAGIALASAIEDILTRDVERLAANAWKTIRDRFSLEAHLERVGDAVDEAAAAPAPRWAKDRAHAFSASPGAAFSGSVPSEGRPRLAALLRSLAGRRVIVHGTGQHTLQLEAIFAAAPARIVAFADDDPARRGRSLWGRPILSPAEAAVAEATDVIISSWMHQAAILARREVYERQGLRVHGIYSESER